MKEELIRLDGSLMALMSMRGNDAAREEDEIRRKIKDTERQVQEHEATRPRNLQDIDDLQRMPAVPYRELRTVLRADEALLSFITTDDSTFAFAVTRDGLRWTRIELGAHELERLVHVLRCGLDESAWRKAPTCRDLLKMNYSMFDRILRTPLPFDVKEAHKLYKDLLGPLDDLIEGKKLLIVPSGPLTQLPFHVLVTDGPGATPRGHAAYGAVAWLARKHAIAILPSVSALKTLRQNAEASRAKRSYVGFGNPLLHGNPTDKRQTASAADARRRQTCAEIQLAGLSGVRRAAGGEALKPGKNGLVERETLLGMVALPDTADELCAVARQAGADDRDIYLGERNSEETLKALSASGRLADFRIVHLATHGLVVGELGAGEPGLVFTPPAKPSSLPGSEGYLTASEVAELKLDADWVVLSACNTASSGGRDNQALSESVWKLTGVWSGVAGYCPGRRGS